MSRLPAVLAGSFVALPALGLAQSEPPLSNSTLQTAARAGVWVLGLAVGVIVLFVFFQTRERLRRQREAEALDAARFEAQMLSSLSPRSKPSVPDQGLSSSLQMLSNLSQSSTSSAEVRPTRPPAAPPPRQSEPPPVASSLSGAECVSRVLHQLRGANLLKCTEGHVELNGDSKAGTILLLTNGKRALLLPYHETEVFTARNLRRFDLLIFVSRDGRAVVVTPLEALIAENLAPAFLPRS